MCMPSTIPGLNGAECPNQCPNDICAPGDQACDMGYDDAGMDNGLIRGDPSWAKTLAAKRLLLQ